MANLDHLVLLKQGVDVWNQWRKDNPNIKLDLRHAKLSGGAFNCVDFGDANLSFVDFSAANLNSANLTGVNLSYADLSDATLNNAHLVDANLRHATLINATFINADLRAADLRGANLNAANLNSAYLVKAYLIDTDLSRADLIEATIGGTIFSNIDLSEVKGLKTIIHEGPSTISIDTITNSQGKIPEVFLRGVGMSDIFITYMSSLTGAAFEYYSCFISHSRKDKAFAERLYADLQAKGVRCWYAPEDLKWGAEIRDNIDRAIHLHDKLLLILSEDAVESDWVEKEVETAFEQEKTRRKQSGQRSPMLFPVRIDEAIMTCKEAWAADIRRMRNIGDFTQWKDHDAYQVAFDRLLRDLKAVSSNNATQK